MSNWCTKVVKLNIPLSRLNEGLVLFTAEPCSMKVTREFRLVGIVWSENLLQKSDFVKMSAVGTLKGTLHDEVKKENTLTKSHSLGKIDGI